MSTYYFHKIGFQEMGSIKNAQETPKRGRYFLISKKFIDFFPHLSSVVMNDKIVISIIPMYESAEQRQVICTMDYHNSRFSDITYNGENPRNEIRLYMNNIIDPNRNFFIKDDIAVFEKFTVQGDTMYSLTRITPIQQGYQQLQDLLNESKYPHTNGVLNGELDFIKKPNFERLSPVVFTDDAESLIKTESTSILTKEDNLASIEASMGSSFFNSTLFRNLVMNAYEYRCAITGKVIRYGDLFNLEAAHIKPQAHNGTFLPCNGIAMSRDMHFAFDKGFFTLDDNYNIVVSEFLHNEWFYKEYNGKTIYVPKVEQFRPYHIYLEHHRQNIFNTFRQIRKI